MDTQLFRQHATNLGLSLEAGWDIGDLCVSVNKPYEYAYQCAKAMRGPSHPDQVLVSFTYVSCNPGITMCWFVGNKSNKFTLTDEHFLALTPTTIEIIKADVILHIHEFEDAESRLKRVMPSLRNTILMELACYANRN